MNKRGIGFSLPCGGSGRCGKCKIKLRGNISSPTETELTLLSSGELSSGIRLACQAEALGAFEAVITDDENDMEITTEIFSADGGINGGINGSLTESINYSLAESEIGVGIDIGTTTLAVYLCGISSGSIISVGAAPNPQRIYGSDVISRINYIMKDAANLCKEKKLLFKAINKIICELCAKAGITTDMITRAAISGNTVMEHIAAEVDPSGIANAPFTPKTLFGYDIVAQKLGLSVNKDASAAFMPCISGYAGGDVTVGIAACDADTARYENIPQLFIDIGTNGEIALLYKGRIAVCSAAAGPAFEGAHIECGMISVSGAVNSIKSTGNGISYTVISGDGSGSGKEPRGICGSALIDGAAVMLENGILSPSGKIPETFYIDKKHNIYISQKDIRELQLAKAAIRAGTDTLLGFFGLHPEDIKRVIISGGFGAHINYENACKIGLLPFRVEAESANGEKAREVVFAGNTSGTGAVRYLTDEKFRARVREIQRKAEYIELSQNEFFTEKYIERMSF